MRNKLLLLTGLLIVFTYTSFAQTEETWKKIENGAFSFSAPSYFKKTDKHGIDSFVEEYIADDIILTFYYGRYSNNMGDWPRETRFANARIDGKEARIGTVR